MASSARPPDRPPELSAAGARVHVRTVREEDVEPYRAAVFASAERMRRWNPINPDDLPAHIERQSANHRTFFVLANEPDPAQPLVGRINLTGAVRGRFRSVAMGYDAYDPYAGRGLFAEGLRLVVTLALTDALQGGMGLHRVEATVQPGNTRSAGLLRSLGFRHEGSSPRLLYLPDDNGRELWRDHERYAVVKEEWPRPPYAAADPRRLVVLLDTGPAAPAGLGLARAVAIELGLPLLPVTLPGLTAVVADCPAGAVVAGALGDARVQAQVAELRSGGADVLPADGAVANAAAAAVAAVGASVGDGLDPRVVTRLALDLRAARVTAGA